MNFSFFRLNKKQEIIFFPSLTARGGKTKKQKVENEAVRDWDSVYISIACFSCYLESCTNDIVFVLNLDLTKNFSSRSFK